MSNKKEDARLIWVKSCPVCEVSNHWPNKGCQHFVVRRSNHLANKSCQEFPRFKSSFLTNKFVKILLIYVVPSQQMSGTLADTSLFKHNVFTLSGSQEAV